MIVDVKDLLQRMYPGDGTTQMPAFEQLNADPSSFIDQAYIDQINIQLSLLSSDLIKDDVNMIIKQLKTNIPEQMEHLIISSLTYYFTHLETVKTLRSGEETLFPNERQLPEFDFDLLTPVWQRHNGDKNGK